MTTTITIDREIVEGLLGLCTSSMDYGSGFYDDIDVEILRRGASALGVPLDEATPPEWKCKYRQGHNWHETDAAIRARRPDLLRWRCHDCWMGSNKPEPPSWPHETE